MLFLIGLCFFGPDNVKKLQCFFGNLVVESNRMLERVRECQKLELPVQHCHASKLRMFFCEYFIRYNAKWGVCYNYHLSPIFLSPLFHFFKKRRKNHHGFTQKHMPQSQNTMYTKLSICFMGKYDFLHKSNIFTYFIKNYFYNALIQVAVLEGQSIVYKFSEF